MATGEPRKLRTSDSLDSASDCFVDPVPLPDKGAAVELTYPNKRLPAPRESWSSRQYVEACHDQSRHLEALPDNAFVLDDNLPFLSELLRTGQRATLIYIDPPYNTGFRFRSRTLEHSYEDSMGSAEYLEFLRRRLVLMRECLTDDGSIYVHIGHQMIGHVKVLVDEVFGARNFLNLITRRKCSSKNFTRNRYANVNDFILYYSKGRHPKWSRPSAPPDKDWVTREYPKIDQATGRRYKLVPVHAPGVRNGETGRTWRGMDPPPGKHWQYRPRKLDEMDKAGLIHWSRNANPRRKVFWSSESKRTLTDYWDWCRDAHHQSTRITGYPTEKNLEMMKVIVSASSSEGDLVVDAFCGSGTTLHAAATLGRRYIGCDASFAAARATIGRMRHGVGPMGDYVGSGLGRNLELPVEVPPDAECKVVTTSDVLERYRPAVSSLVAI